MERYSGKKQKRIHDDSPKFVTTHMRNINKAVENNSTSLMSGTYNCKTFQQKLKSFWLSESASQEFNNGLASSGNVPFKYMLLSEFINSDVLDDIIEELSGMKFLKKSNDLYKFKQTGDLMKVSSNAIGELKRFFVSFLRDWIQSVTDTPLSDTVDLGCSLYQYVDYLLCHDDQLEGRRFAFILYLVPPWDEEDGGSLDLFNVDDNGNPSTVATQIFPAFNLFALFEVSPVSFHQPSDFQSENDHLSTMDFQNEKVYLVATSLALVSEVLSQSKGRLSINGWFHGTPLKSNKRSGTEMLSLYPPVTLEEQELYSWINPVYLDERTQAEIRRKFVDQNEIQLYNFLKLSKYKLLEDALERNDLNWNWAGPNNKKKFQVLTLADASKIIRQCYRLMRSEAVFLILSQLTGLELHQLFQPYNGKKPNMDNNRQNKANANTDRAINCLESVADYIAVNCTQIRKWTDGCYSMVSDDDHISCHLSSQLFVSCNHNWKIKYGGCVDYLARDEDKELLTVIPQSNTLALVYCDKETMKFTKYINFSGGKHKYYDVYSEYKEL